jgi:hypothetical protein
MSTNDTGWSSFTPPAPGSLFVTLYDSQGYDRIILTRLHAGLKSKYLRSNFPTHTKGEYILNLTNLYLAKKALFEDNMLIFAQMTRDRQLEKHMV